MFPVNTYVLVKTVYFFAHSFYFSFVSVLFCSYEIVSLNICSFHYTDKGLKILGGLNKMSRQIKLGTWVS